jgi:hypothetical protein
VIRSGSVIGRARIVSMPHWGGIIRNDKLRALVAYLKRSSDARSRAPVLETQQAGATDVAAPAFGGPLGDQ